MCYNAGPMMVAESRTCRRLVGRLDRGTDVLEGFAAVCRAHEVRAGELRATGALEQVVLGEHDQRARVPRTPRGFDASFEILTLYGTVSERDGKPAVQARATLSRERDNGIEVLGGQLLSGRVFAVEFVLEAFDDLLLRRAHDPHTGLHLWGDAIAPSRMEWKDVVAASAASAAPAVSAVSGARGEPAKALTPDGAMPPPAEEVHVMAGDYIDHPKFGRCQVERVGGDYEFVSARLRNQRLVQLSLDVITLVFAAMEGDRRLFRVVLAR